MKLNTIQSDRHDYHSIVKKRLKMLPLFAFLFYYFPFVGNAQSIQQTVIGSSGSSKDQLSWTTGEAVIKTGKNSSAELLILTQGFHQPEWYADSIVEIGDKDGVTLYFTVYPNPTTESVTLRAEGIFPGDFNYSIFDLNGQHLSTEAVNKMETLIDFSQMPAGTYILVLAGPSLHLKNFKIIKL
jgi:Secretion system C-terminal sorting domain